MLPISTESVKLDSPRGMKGSLATIDPPLCIVVHVYFASKMGDRAGISQKPFTAFRKRVCRRTLVIALRSVVLGTMVQMWATAVAGLPVAQM
jgi:hypothetical protein